MDHDQTPRGEPNPTPPRGAGDVLSGPRYPRPPGGGGWGAPRATEKIPDPGGPRGPPLDPGPKGGEGP